MVTIFLTDLMDSGSARLKVERKSVSWCALLPMRTVEEQLLPVQKRAGLHPLLVSHVKVSSPYIKIKI